MTSETEIMAALARVEEAIYGLRERLTGITGRLDQINGSVREVDRRMDDHVREDESRHGAIWSSITTLKVQDAKVAGTMFVLMLIFGAILSWVLK